MLDVGVLGQGAVVVDPLPHVVVLEPGRRVDASRDVRDPEQLRAASRRSSIEALLDPNGLGAFRVVCFAKDAPTDGLRMFGGVRSEGLARYP